MCSKRYRQLIIIVLTTGTMHEVSSSLLLRNNVFSYDRMCSLTIQVLMHEVSSSLLGIQGRDSATLYPNLVTARFKQTCHKKFSEALLWQAQQTRNKSPAGSTARCN